MFNSLKLISSKFGKCCSDWERSVYFLKQHFYVTNCRHFDVWQILEPVRAMYAHTYIKWDFNLAIDVSFYLYKNISTLISSVMKYWLTIFLLLEQHNLLPVSDRSVLKSVTTSIREGFKRIACKLVLQLSQPSVISISVACWHFYPVYIYFIDHTNRLQQQKLL